MHATDSTDGNLTELINHKLECDVLSGEDLLLKVVVLLSRNNWYATNNEQQYEKSRRTKNQHAKSDKSDKAETKLTKKHFRML